MDELKHVYGVVTIGTDPRPHNYTIPSYTVSVYDVELSSNNNYVMALVDAYVDVRLGRPKFLTSLSTDIRTNVLEDLAKVLRIYGIWDGMDIPEKLSTGRRYTLGNIDDDVYHVTRSLGVEYLNLSDDGLRSVYGISYYTGEEISKSTGSPIWKLFELPDELARCKQLLSDVIKK